MNLLEIGFRIGPPEVQHRLGNTSRIFVRELPLLKGWQIVMEDRVCICHPPFKVSWWQRPVKYLAEVSTGYLLAKRRDRTSLVSRTVQGYYLSHHLSERL